MGLFRHVCLFRLKGTADDRLIANLIGFSARLRTTFPEILTCRFERNQSRKAAGYMLVLYSEFTDEPAFRRYVASRLHDEIASFLDPVVEDTLVADVII